MIRDVTSIAIHPTGYLTITYGKVTLLVHKSKIDAVMSGDSDYRMYLDKNDSDKYVLTLKQHKLLTTYLTTGS